MESKVQSVLAKKALTKLMNTLTPAAKKKAFPISLIAINGAVYLVGENDQFHVASQIPEAEIVKEGEINLDGKLFYDYLKEYKGKGLTIEGIPEGVFLFDDDDELTEWSPYTEKVRTDWIDEKTMPVCSVETEVFYAALKELKVMTIKTYHAASEHVLFRLRGQQLNGRSTNMKAVVTNSIKVEGFRTDLTDILFTSKQVTKLTQFIDGVKKEPLRISKVDEFIRIDTVQLSALTKAPTFTVSMPDVTPFVRKIDKLPKEQFQTVQLNELLPKIARIEKVLKKEKEGPRVAKLSSDASEVEFREEALENSVLVNTKDLMKVLQSIAQDEVKMLITNQAIYIVYEKDESLYKAVVMLVKEEG